MIKKTFIFALCLTAMSAEAGVDKDKKAKFVNIIEQHGCKMHNLSPRPELVEAIFTSGLVRDDLPPIALDLLKSGEAVKQGEYLLLKSKGCK